MQQQACDLQRLALVVAKPKATHAELEDACRQIVVRLRDDAPEFLAEHGLAGLWRHRLLRCALTPVVSVTLLDSLARASLADAGLYLAQKSALQELDALFEANAIVYAAIKGAHVREAVYAPPELSPCLRPAADIDILIASAQRDAAARALINAGYALRADAETISHEASFVRDPVVIDLHWDILRPGRTRAPVCDDLLAARRRVSWFWGLSDADAIFLMLVHPAFVRYVCNLALGSVHDFMLYSRQRNVDWDAVAHKLEASGLKTAGWTTLAWFARVAPPDALSVPRQFIDRIRPHPLRARYLSTWLKCELPVRWWNARLAIQLGFTLLLHDRLSDATRALLSTLSARRNGSADPFVKLGVN